MNSNPYSSYYKLHLINFSAPGAAAIGGAGYLAYNALKKNKDSKKSNEVNNMKSFSQYVKFSMAKKASRITGKVKKVSELDNFSVKVVSENSNGSGTDTVSAEYRNSNLDHDHNQVIDKEVANSDPLSRVVAADITRNGMENSAHRVSDAINDGLVTAGRDIGSGANSIASAIHHASNVATAGLVGLGIYGLYKVIKDLRSKKNRTPEEDQKLAEAKKLYLAKKASVSK